MCIYMYCMIGVSERLFWECTITWVILAVCVGICFWRLKVSSFKILLLHEFTSTNAE